MSRDDAEMLAQLQAENRPDTTSAGLILACVGLLGLVWAAGFQCLAYVIEVAAKHPVAAQRVAIITGLFAIAAVLTWVDAQTQKMTRDHADQVGGYEP